MSRLTVLLLALTFGALACERDAAPKSPSLTEVMPNLPLPPGASFVSRSGGADALLVTVRSPEKADAIAAYYRDLFKKDGWRLVKDGKDREGAVVLLAEQQGPPLWVRIKSEGEGKGTLVDLAGARLSEKQDSSKRVPGVPSKSSS
jgi:hypothetical protein